MQAPTHSELQFIDTADALLSFCQSIENSDYLAIDTEFVRDKTYYPQLCLIQIASHNAIACIDPLAIEDLSPVLAILSNPRILKVFHAARQDLEVLYVVFNDIPEPVFDTQLAATLLGLGEQIGYANLVKHYLNRQLGKQHARADWERRPLDKAQIEYAADDVRYLIQIYPMITRQLAELGRLEWLEDDLQALTNVDLYRPTGADLWSRISGNQKLRRKQLAVLRELSQWREQLAQKLDKPRKWVIQDNLLVAISSQCPPNVEKLKSVRGLNENFINRHGEDVIQCIKRALALPESQWPVLEKRRQLDKDQEALVDSLLAIVKLKAAQHRLNVSAITNRAQLEKLVLNERQIDLLQGWRRELVGNSLLAFLNGENALICQEGKLDLTED